MRNAYCVHIFTWLWLGLLLCYFISILITVYACMMKVICVFSEIIRNSSDIISLNSKQIFDAFNRFKMLLLCKYTKNYYLMPHRTGIPINSNRSGKIRKFIIFIIYNWNDYLTTFSNKGLFSGSVSSSNLFRITLLSLMLTWNGNVMWMIHTLSTLPSFEQNVLRQIYSVWNYNNYRFRASLVV